MTHKNVNRIALLCASILLTVAVSSWAQQPNPLARDGSSAITIGPGDLLTVSVFDTPELSGPARVTEDGDVSLPLIGVVHVSGMSPAQAEQLLRRKLIEGQLIKDPQVGVLITEYAAQGVTVAGEVMKPGIYPVLGRKRLRDVISMASGLTPVAGTRAVITRRGHPNGPEAAVFKDIGGNLSGENPQLEPGDTVVIERAGIVFVLGDVTKPGGFVMDRGRMSVLEALALAQGTTKTASLGRARLLRRTDARFEQLPLPLKTILSAKSADPDLQAGDVIYVPSAAIKTTFTNMQAILSSVAGATIYAVR